MIKLTKWTKRAEAAIKRGKFTHDDRFKGTTNGWTCCVIGEKLNLKQHNNFQRQYLTKQGEKLERKFVKGIYDNKPKSVLETIKKIESATVPCLVKKSWRDKHIVAI